MSSGKAVIDVARTYHVLANLPFPKTLYHLNNTVPLLTGHVTDSEYLALDEEFNGVRLHTSIGKSRVEGKGEAGVFESQSSTTRVRKSHQTHAEHFLVLALRCRTFQSMLSVLNGAQALKLQASKRIAWTFSLTGLFLVEAANNVLMFIAAIEDHFAVVQERWKKEQSEKEFLEALCLQPDPPVCVDKIIASNVGLSSLQNAFWSNISVPFLNGSATDALLYLQAPQIKTISSGQFLTKMLQAIAEPPIFWNAFHFYTEATQAGFVKESNTSIEAFFSTSDRLAFRHSRLSTSSSSDMFSRTCRPSIDEQEDISDTDLPGPKHHTF
ncbi:uncharacterized protein ARMOST_17249 [Armillaria ostoyae]|uniref:Uncharacterized protein n=1 Tax=Armillaria ostoyae TaxID=47428 RepID=A0A284RYG1_ARMOS|nr:uncharacterized protein ARMOST_17249 [Armillaria ostoyae]